MRYTTQENRIGIAAKTTFSINAPFDALAAICSDI
jgi:hypothetical protein